MQRYQSVHAGLQTVIASAVIYFLGNLQVLDRFAIFKSIPFTATQIQVAAVPLLFLLFRKSPFIANLMIEKVPFVSFRLRRLLSGKEFIEGDWPLVVMEADKRTPKYFGFLTITYERGQLQVYGDDWNLDGTLAHKFRSQQSSYENRKLQYWYAQGASAIEPSMFGYTRIYFFPERGPIERHAGEFLDKEHTSPPFYAKRIPYKTFERRLRTREEKFEAAKRFWTEVEPKIAAMRDARIDRDFG